MGLKPAYRILANDEDITAVIAERFSSMTIVDQAGLESDTLDLVLTDHDPERPIKLPPKGAELMVWLGYDDSAQRMGLYVVDGVGLSGPPDKVTIGAKAAPFEGTPTGIQPLQSQRSRSWPAGTTLGAIVERIAADHELEPAVSDTLAGVTLPHVDQVNESDMNLLTRLAKDHDAIAKPAGGKLVLAKKGASRTVSGAELPPVRLTRADVSTWDVDLSDADAFGSVIATYRDQDEAADVEVRVGDEEPVHRLTHTYPDKASAAAAAEAELSKSQRAGSKLDLSLPGTPDLVAEVRVILSTFRDGVDGEWVATRVRHVVNSSGWKCSAAAEVPPAE